MTEQKQHVDLHRKLSLRRRLLRDITPVAAYVPFIGDGDIAAELYGDWRIYGADIDPERVKVATRRLPEAQVKVADCERWPFGECEECFALADFDAYAYPYGAFRAFWERAEKADRLAVFFTDTERMVIGRGSWPRRWRQPDGSEAEVCDLAAMRALITYYWRRVVWPWAEGAFRPYRIVSTSKYLRHWTLYWGAVIERV